MNGDSSGATCTSGRRRRRRASRAEGYDGSYSRVTDFPRAWRQGEGHSVSSNAFVPLVVELGEAHPFDGSEEGLVVGGIYYRTQVAQHKLENPARLSSTCLVMAARNRYSVPCELAGQMLSTRLYPGRVGAGCRVQTADLGGVVSRRCARRLRNPRHRRRIRPPAPA